MNSTQYQLPKRHRTVEQLEVTNKAFLHEYCSVSNYVISFLIIWSQTSCRNAIKALGYEIVDITTAEEIAAAKVIVFPGVGIFGQAMQVCVLKHYSESWQQTKASCDML